VEEQPSPPPAFSIRYAAEDDVTFLAEIESRVHGFPWTLGHFQEELIKPYSRTLVLTDDETDSERVGYLVFWVMFEECQILNVAVDENYRRKGFAKQLVRRALALSLREGLKRATLDVRKSNLPAIHLYQSIGFSIGHLRRSFYSNGEDAYQMTLSLEGDNLQFF
jgi:ribosomal-protein-alanine N-acetyltransferase